MPIKITEKHVTASIRGLLSTIGVWHYKHWGGPMGEKGIADIIGCHNGRMVAIEVKAPGGRVSPAQTHFLDCVRKAGGIAILAYSVDDVIKGLGVQDRFLN